MKVTNLQCEYMENPLGIDVPAPQLSWSCISDLHQDEQTAFRIILFDEHEILWDTGKITSSESVISCNGIPLQSNKHYLWKVCVWNKDGIQSPFSETASFDTGFLHHEWTAKWIGKKEMDISLPVFTKEFMVDKKVFYSSYDVKAFLSMGKNALFVYLGKGFYYNNPVENRFNRVPKTWGKLMLLCQLEIEFEDGSRTIIGTDETSIRPFYLVKCRCYQ